MPALGAGGREFESRYPDKVSLWKVTIYNVECRYKSFFNVYRSSYIAHDCNKDIYADSKWLIQFSDCKITYTPIILARPKRIFFWKTSIKSLFFLHMLKNCSIFAADLYKYIETWQEEKPPLRNVLDWCPQLGKPRNQKQIHSLSFKGQV